jgi:hypothetical protein
MRSQNARVLVWAHYLRSDSIALAKAPVLLLLRCLGYWFTGGYPIPCPHDQPPLYRFATKERNGLLLYNGRFNEKHDFVALEVIQEQVQLTFSAGEPRVSCPCPAPKSSCLRPSDLKPRAFPPSQTRTRPPSLDMPAALPLPTLFL